MQRKSMRIPTAAVMGGMALLVLAPSVAEAQRGGGGRGGGGGRTATSVQRPSGGSMNTGNVNRGNNVNTGNVNRGNNVNTGNINRGNINTGDINIDVDNGWGGGYGGYHPVARGVAVGAAVGTAIAIGSTYYAVPPACAPTPYSGVTYYSCGGVWYQPRYQGTSVVYVVVPAPG